MSTTVTNNNTIAEAPVPPQLNTLEDYQAYVDTLVADGTDLQPLVGVLLEEKFKLQGALEQVRAFQEELREEIEALCSPEQYPVVLTGIYEGDRLTVEVAAGNTRTRVAVHPDVP